MERRRFLLTAAAAVTAPMLSRPAIARDSTGIVPFTPGKAQRITNVVGQLRKIGKERRAVLTANPENKSAEELTESLTEIDEIEVVNTNADAAPGDTLRLITWNTERGRFWPDCARLIREHPALKNPDVVFLGEMDMGMARSWNKHTTREMAAELQMNYAYAIEYLELSGGEEQERADYPGENEWGYHGNAILSKYPLHDVRALRFPGRQFWYEHYQKRLGGRCAVLACVDLGGTKVALVSVHLESHDRGRVRQQQMQLLLEELENTAADMPVLFGGDLNGRPNEPMFEDLKAAGFILDDCNDMNNPTTQKCVDGVISFHEENKKIDYITVRGAKPVHDETSPITVPAVYPPVLKGQSIQGKYLGDHAVVTCKVRLG
ncbi:MAG: endonuclease/exonuclease/phosphatase family protein [bacterium]